MQWSHPTGKASAKLAKGTCKIVRCQAWCHIPQIAVQRFMESTRARRGILFVTRQCLCVTITVVARHLQEKKYLAKYTTGRRDRAGKPMTLSWWAMLGTSTLLLATSSQSLSGWRQVAGCTEPDLSCSFVASWLAKAWIFFIVVTQ